MAHRGGGFAALDQALRIPHSFVLAANPQTDITKYSYYPSYFQKAWNERYLEPSIPPIELSVIERFSKPVRAHVIYLQNTQDESHVTLHKQPFQESVHPSNEVFFLDCDLGEGHIAPDAKSFKAIFKVMCEAPNWEEMVQEISRLDIYSSVTAPANVAENFADTVRKEGSNT